MSVRGVISESFLAEDVHTAVNACLVKQNVSILPASIVDNDVAKRSFEPSVASGSPKPNISLTAG